MVATTVAPTTTTTSTMVTPDTAPPTTASSSSALIELEYRFESTPLRASYVFRDGGQETTVVFSQDPNRVPPVTSVMVPAAFSKLITVGDQATFCDTRAGQCFVVAGGTGGTAVGLLGPFIGGPFLGTGVTAASSVDESTEEIASRTGVCFTFAPPVDIGFGSDTIRQCVDSEFGFTLSIQTSNTGAAFDTVLELVEFEEPLSDDFTPSGPVVESP